MAILPFLGLSYIMLTFSVEWFFSFHHLHPHKCQPSCFEMFCYFSVIVASSCQKVSEIPEMARFWRPGNWETGIGVLFLGRIAFLMKRKSQGKKKGSSLLWRQISANPVCASVSLFSGLAVLKLQPTCDLHHLQLRDAAAAGSSQIWIHPQRMSESATNKHGLRTSWPVMNDDGGATSPRLNVDSTAQPLDSLSGWHVQVTEHLAGPVPPSSQPADY